MSELPHDLHGHLVAAQADLYGVPPGSRVEVIAPMGREYRLRLPDGRIETVPYADIEWMSGPCRWCQDTNVPLDEWDERDLAEVVDLRVSERLSFAQACARVARGAARPAPAVEARMRALLMRDDALDIASD